MKVICRRGHVAEDVLKHSEAGRAEAEAQMKKTQDKIMKIFAKVQQRKKL